MIYQFNEIEDFKNNNLIKKYQHDAGWDIRSGESCIMPAKTSVVIRTGLHIVIPAGFKGVIQSRSGNAMAFKIEASNAGVIDHGYLGEVLVRLYNHGEIPFQVNEGDRVAQIVFDFSLTIPVSSLLGVSFPQYIPEMSEAEFYSLGTERGVQGFGHTGVA